MGKTSEASLKKLEVIKDGKVVSAKQLKDERKRLTATDRLTLAWVQDFLSMHRDQIQQTKVSLETGVIQNAVKDSQCDIKARDVFPDSYMSFKFPPKWWMADFLVDELKFARAKVDAVDELCPSHGVKKLFIFSTGLGETVYWPRPCLEKVVLSKFALYFAVHVVKERYKKAAQELKGGPAINYGKISPYQYQWGEAKTGGVRELLAITHVATGAKAEDLPARVLSSHRVACEYDDLLLQFVGAAKYKPLAKDLFPDGAAPFVPWTKDAAVAKAAEVAAECGQDKTPTRAPGTGVLTTVVKQRTERLKKAASEKTPLKKMTVPLQIS